MAEIAEETLREKLEEVTNAIKVVDEDCAAHEARVRTLEESLDRDIESIDKLSLDDIRTRCEALFSKTMECESATAFLNLAREKLRLRAATLEKELVKFEWVREIEVHNAKVVEVYQLVSKYNAIAERLKNRYDPQYTKLYDEAIEIAKPLRELHVAVGVFDGLRQRASAVQMTLLISPVVTSGDFPSSNDAKLAIIQMRNEEAILEYIKNKGK